MNLESEEELNTPWPLPEFEYPLKKAPHAWVERLFFLSPTWCGHCLLFVYSSVGKQGFECSKCKMCVHLKCFDEVKSKNCWNDAADQVF